MAREHESMRVWLLVPAVVSALLGASSRSFAADAGPTVGKDSVLVNAYTLNVFKKDYDKCRQGEL